MSEPQIHTIDWVSERLNRGAPRWTVHRIDQDGNGSGHVFPKETLEWRAAEYGLTDIDEILDVVLHEPFLPDEPDRDDAAARAGMVTSNGPDAEPITLLNAASTADALASHRLRVADVKQTRARVQTPDKGLNPLDVIRQGGVSAASVRTKREVVDVHRWQLLYEGLPIEPITEEATHA